MAGLVAVLLLAAVLLRILLSVLLPAAWAQLVFLPAALLAGLSGGWIAVALSLLVMDIDLAFHPLPGLAAPQAGGNALLLEAILVVVGGIGAMLRRLQLVQPEMPPPAELQAAEARIALLQHELSHRVKNNFQLVGSLLRLQARRSGNETASRILNTTVLRIQGMSALHESLYRNRDIGRVELAAYLREVCDRVAEAQTDGRPIVVAFTGDVTELPGEYALPLGLAVSELVSDALRHAFVGGAAGTIAVSLQKRGEDVMLAVEDDGIGLPDRATEAGGFGMLLVASCASQVEGELHTQHRPTRFEIRFPAALAV
jgi:two-component sensor histidine kinase